MSSFTCLCVCACSFTCVSSFTCVCVFFHAREFFHVCVRVLSRVCEFHHNPRAPTQLTASLPQAAVVVVVLVVVVAAVGIVVQLLATPSAMAGEVAVD